MSDEPIDDYKVPGPFAPQNANSICTVLVQMIQYFCVRFIMSDNAFDERKHICKRLM